MEDTIDKVESSKELDELLHEYKSGLKEIDNENINEHTETTGNPSTERIQTVAEDKRSDSDQSTSGNVQTEWRGNPAYYQTGNKAGQLRPLAAKQQQKNAPPKEEMQISGTLIDGALFIMLIDLLFPLAITFVNNKASDTKIKVEDLQLTEKQKKDLTPISDEVIKYLVLRANPVWLMAIAMTGIYGINFMAAKSAASSEMKINKE